MPLRADGTYDEKEEKIIREIGAWLKVNGEGIFSTRPWTIFGEGPIADTPIELKDQGFNEGSYLNAGADEIRFTQTPKHLYAIALGWPENGNILVRSLAKDSPNYKGRIKRVELVGYGKVPFTRTADGLSVNLPADAPRSIAPVLKIAK